MKKATIKIFKKGEEPSERSYWLSVSTEKRFQALEELRQIVYGKNNKPSLKSERIVKIIKRKKE